MSTMTNPINAKQVAELRAKTGAGMMDCKKALEEAGGDMAKAEDLLRVKYAARADKRADRSAAEGVIEVYLHFNGRVATMVELNCETDFVANTPEFKQLAKDLALHVASARPIAVHCKSGYRSSIASSLLLRAGFKQVLNVTGGFDAWTAQKLPVVVEKTAGACPA